MLYGYQARPLMHVKNASTLHSMCARVDHATGNEGKMLPDTGVAGQAARHAAPL